MWFVVLSSCPKLPLNRWKQQKLCPLFACAHETLANPAKSHFDSLATQNVRNNLPTFEPGVTLAAYVCRCGLERRVRGC